MPPRRLPPPPPNRSSPSVTQADVLEHPSGRHPLGISAPPPPPRRRTSTSLSSVPAYLPTPETENDDEDVLGLSSELIVRPQRPRIPVRRRTVDEIEQDNPELGRLLRRHPPPPPPDKQGPPPLPSNRPIQAALPTPSPEAEIDEPEYTGSPVADAQPTCLKCHDFSAVDAHAAQYPRQSVQTLEQLAYDLTAPFTTETDKFRAIFTWLHHNIDYDTQSFFAGTVRAMSPEETLRSGLAVCDGYAGLLEHLAELAGLTAHKVSGHGKGHGFQPLPPGAPVPPESPGHAWNCCYMDGVWQLVDSCWGAGALMGTVYNRRFAPEWFSMTPIEFVQRHFPTDRSFQLIGEEEGGVVEWADYILAAARPQLFGCYHEQNLHPDTIQPISKEILGGRTTTFSVWKLCEHMSTAEEDNYVFAISTSDGKLVPLERNDQGGWSAEAYVPKGGDKASLYAVSTLTEASSFGGVREIDAFGYPLEAFKRAIGRMGMSFKGLAEWVVV